MAEGRLLHRVQSRLTSTPPETEPVIERQSGAIPFSVVDGTPTFLLVTSRRSGRWIFPKGKVPEGLTAAQSAAREALEEAGVEGETDDAPIGSYRSWKIRGIRRYAIEIDMYPLRVINQQDDWKEKGQRHRHWVTLAEARRLLNQRGLKELVALLDGREREVAEAVSPLLRAS